MKRLAHQIILMTLLTVAGCSSVPPQAPKAAVKIQPPKPVKPIVPSRPPVQAELVGRYSLFEGSESTFDIREQGGKLLVYSGKSASELTPVSATRYTLPGGRQIDFQYSNEGKYDRFSLMLDGRPQRFIRDDSLLRSRTGVTQQAVYTWQMVNDLKTGDYTYSRFISPARGVVDYSVYLPPDWHRHAKQSYPMVIFLHGQTGWEHSFPQSVPASQLNSWIKRGVIPPMVIVSLRTGRINDREEEQWSSPRNETLLTSDSGNELRAFLSREFHAGLTPKTTAIHGHSRGARGAIHYALKYPQRFSSAVANAFVSDYALPEMMQIAAQNQDSLRKSGIPLRISIGDRDEFELNLGRKSSAVIDKHLTDLGIKHQYQVFAGVDHGFVSIWNVPQANGIPNGLAELQFHAGAWSAASK